MSGLTLVIGSKTFSSWSLRPWLAIKHTGLPFTEVVVPLYKPGTKESILRHSPTGKVPVLKHGDLTVWDSLAIIEYLAELAPESGLWPADRAARAIARSACAEMHSGFPALRSNMGMNVLKSAPGEGRTPDTLADIARIQALWGECRARFGAGGPFLFGTFSAADCMFAPVVTRFETYAVDLDPVAKAYVEAVLATPEIAEWKAGARAES
jgi:glutathione S-transferase